MSAFALGMGLAGMGEGEEVTGFNSNHINEGIVSKEIKCKNIFH